MKITFVCNEYPPGPHGGIGTFTQVLARALVQVGHQVRVTGIYRPSYPALEYEEDQGVRVWRLRGSFSRGRWILMRYRLFHQISQWAKAGESDLIEVPDYESIAAFWPKLDVPIVCRIHGSVTYSSLASSRSRMLLRWAAIRRADYWCAVSQYAADLVRKTLNIPAPDAILYNLVEACSGIYAEPNSSNKIVFSGTLSMTKGVISLIRAWNQVVQVHPEATLHVYGKDSNYNNSSMREYLQELLSEEAHNTVFFHGHVPRSVLIDAFQRARAAVFPSYSEAFAVSPLESMSVGCPTIYTCRASGPELIVNGVNGLLVDPDHIEEVANAIILLLEDSVLAQRLGTAGLETVKKKYTLDIVTSQNMQFYKYCMADFLNKRM